jgi:hypothetical protein
MDEGVGGGGRAPTDFAPHQQLAWVLEEMVAQAQAQDHTEAVPQSGVGVQPNHAKHATKGAASGSKGEVIKAGSKASGASSSSSGCVRMSVQQWAHLHTVVLPALLHELRLPWHAALWACATAVGVHSSVTGGGVGVVGARAEGALTEAAGPSVLLHSAVRTLVAAGIAGIV